MRSYRLYLVIETGLDWRERIVSFSKDREKSVGYAARFAARFVRSRAIRYTVRLGVLTWADILMTAEEWGRWDADHGEPNGAAAVNALVRGNYIRGYTEAKRRVDGIGNTVQGE